MTLRELIKETVGDVTFCCEEGKTADWKLLDYDISYVDNLDRCKTLDNVGVDYTTKDIELS